MTFRGPIPCALLIALLVPMRAAVEAQGAPSVLAPHVDSVRLFKNGIVTVRETVTLPGPGVHWLPGAPDPLHGTFGAKADVPIRVTRSAVELPTGSAGRAYPTLDGRELAGRIVRVHFIEEHLPPVTGEVREIPSPWERGDTDPSQPPPGWPDVDPYGRSFPRTRQARTELVLISGESEFVIPTARIGSLEVLGGPERTSQPRPALRLEAEGPPGVPIEVTIDYATLGAVWTPSYELDLRDPSTLTIRERAEVHNELADWVDTEVTLVSGVPSFDFQHLLSLLSPATDLVSFLRTLSYGPPRRPRRQGNVNTVASQQVSPDAFGSTAGGDFGEDLGSTGVDLRLRSIGRSSLAAGETMHVVLGESQAPYERIITWSRLYERSWWGSWYSEPEKDTETALPMESIRFENPFTDSLTTAPALVVDEGGLRSQSVLGWTEPGEEMVVPLTRALSVRVQAEEKETARSQGSSRSPSYVQWTGTIQIENLRSEAISLHARIEFWGTLESATGDPRVEQREQLYRQNTLHRLTWVVSVGPGEKRVLTYSYRRSP